MGPYMEGKEGKPRFKKGFWRPEEDLILKKYVEAHGEGNWTVVSKKSGLMRGAKSCRLRWKNYLRPNIKRGMMSEDEKDLIIRLHKLLGNRWSLIAGRLPGRTDNEVKNYWNTHLNKKNSAPPPPPPPPAATPPQSPPPLTNQPQIHTHSPNCLHNLNINDDYDIINQYYSPFFHNYDTSFFPILDNLLLSTGPFECHVDETPMHETIFRQLQPLL